MRKIVLVVTIALLLATLGCQHQPQALEASTTQPSDVPTSQPSQTPVVRPDTGMVEPTVTLAIIQVITDTVAITPRPRPSDCPHLESRLYDLIVAEDPADLAQTTGLFYEDNATRVVIELASPETDASFLAEYGARTETQTGSLVQALVPLTKLCDLSNNPRVEFVREPRTAISPQG
jgi:hypothetical protein